MTTTPATGSQITNSYDKTGRLQSTTDGNGTTSFAYDAVGRITSVTRGGRTTSYTHDNAGRPITVTYPAGQGTVTYSYDGAGRLESITDWAGRTTSYSYDANSRVSSVTRPGDLLTSFTYDVLNRPTAEAHSRNGSPLLSLGYTYDAAGNLATYTDDLGTATFGYDDLNRLVSAAYPGGQDYAYSYDPVGNILSATRPSETSTYTYDLADRITSTGPAGNPGSPTDALQSPTTNTASGAGGGWTDPANAYVDDTTYATASLAADSSYGSDFAGFDFSAIPAGATINSVSADVVWRRGGDGVTLGVQLLNDGVLVGDEATATPPLDTDTPASASVTSGLTLVDLLDGGLSVRVRASRGSALPTDTTKAPTTDTASGAGGGWTDPANAHVDDTTYATASLAAATTYASDFAGFDFSAIPTDATINSVAADVVWRRGGEDVTLGVQLVNDGVAVGDETAATPPLDTDTSHSASVTSGLTLADLQDGGLAVRVRATRATGEGSQGASLQVVGVTVTYTTPGGTQTASLQVVSVTVNYTAGGGTAAAPVYDANGNMLSDGSYGNRTYTYDALGRLTGVTGNGLTATYELDGFGNRWAETVDGATTAFDLDLAQANPTVLADGARNYLPGMPAAGWEENGVWHSGLVDQHGSVLGTVSGGVLSPLKRYDPYGAPRPGSAGVSGIGFTGEWTNATGLVNLRFRQYDPVLARFIGRDSFGGFPSLPQSANRHAFAMANPLLATDPSGHFNNHFLHPAYEFLTSPEGASLTLQSFGGIGDVYSLVSGLIGHDMIAGRALSGEERALYIASILPGLTPAMARGLRGLDNLAPHADEAVDGLSMATRGSRFAPDASGLGLDAFGSVARRSDFLPPAASPMSRINAVKRVGDATAGPRITLNQARAAAARNGIDTRMFELQYEAGQQASLYGYVSTRGDGVLLRAANGRYMITLTDAGLSSERAAVNTIAHELNHLREAQRHGPGWALEDHGPAYRAGEIAELFFR